MTDSYNGFPWRSRFLRSPKIGLELAARDDFVALGEPSISVVKLGMKTGNDNFFFLTATGERSTASRVHVTGLGGWTGGLPKADLLPGVQSPKDLDTERGRRAAIPTGRGGTYAGSTYYLYPRPGRLQRDVREYVAYGEARNVHTGNLVRSNGDPAGWYRQTRNQIRSRWALPYNSGYDYGAVDNAVKAVLNGRFVGVEPAEGIDSILLGGILNSTFVTLMRLLEGVATGNEGAFDVGPPAARVMRIPDPRKMTEQGAEEVRAVMAEILESGILPHAPLRDGTVPSLRQRLDLAVLVALGQTRGEAASVVDRVHRSYSRWRGAVEAVEDQMQEHRRQLARRGGSRNENPAVRAARTVWDELAPVSAPLLSDLQAGEHQLIDPLFVRTDDSGQEALFEQTYVLDQDRRPLDLGYGQRVDLAKFVRGLGVQGPFPLPVNPDACARILTDAQAAEAAFLAEAARRARAHISDDLAGQVVTYVRRAWIAKSVSELRQNASEDQAAEVLDEEEPSLFDTEGLVPPVS